MYVVLRCEKKKRGLLGGDVAERIGNGVREGREDQMFPYLDWLNLKLRER